MANEEIREIKRWMIHSGLRIERYWNVIMATNKMHSLMISKTEFINKIQALPKTILSKTGNASYTNFSLRGGILTFDRINTGEPWELNIEELYEIYKTNSFINTTVIKNITGGRVNSPSVAVLMAIGCIDAKGNRIS
jgi:hypothetical protein